MSSQYVAMLREGVAAELPWVTRALATVPHRIVVSREDPRWAAVSGFGASWLLNAAGNALATVPRATGFRDPASWLTGAFAIAGAALGIAVAVRAGGRRGLLWYAVLLVANAVVVLVVELPFYIQTCAQGAGQNCSPLRLLMPYVFTLAGLVVSAAAVWLVRSGAAGTNPILSGGGAIALAETLVFVIYRLMYVPATDPVTVVAVGLGLTGATMLAAGAVIRRRSTGWRALIAFASIVAVLWLGSQWPSMWDIVRGAFDRRNAVVLYYLLNGPVEIAALFLGWMLLLPGAHDGGGLMEVRGGVEADEQDPAARG